MVFLDLGGDGAELGSSSAIDEIVFIYALDGLVGWDLDDVKGVNLLELFGLGEGGTGHTGELVVEAEEVLEGDGGKSHRLLFDGDAFLGLNGLVETFVVAATLHQTASMLVHDHDVAAVGDDVIFIAFENDLGAESLLHMVDQAGVAGGVEILDAEQLLNFLYALVGEGDTAAFFVKDVIVGGELGGNLGELVVGVGIVASGRGDNKWGASLVNQNGVHLVHDGEVEFALAEELGLGDHIVA